MQYPSRVQQLLVISNGHGEDAIACQILQPLQRLSPASSIVALPIVGVGQAYQAQGVPLLTRGQNLPSGGFLGPHLWQDWQQGWWGLTGRQIRALRQWSKRGDVILAVGDIVPLLLAVGSGLPFAFVGTAKSEYGLADWPRRQSIYWPWERKLMAHPRCRGMFPRDRLTALSLQRWPIPVFDCGNPMMDDLEPQMSLPLAQLSIQPRLKILLLPGSHEPEVFRNWRLILRAIAGLVLEPEAYLFLGAIAPNIDPVPLQRILREQEWFCTQNLGSSLPAPYWLYGQNQSQLLLISQGFRAGLHAAEIVIAMAGTATEQAVGLGKPVITFPGSGPQFTAPFAAAQARLLGSSLFLLKGPQQLPAVLHQIQEQEGYPQQWLDNGRQRMGEPVAGQRIAHRLHQYLLEPLGNG
ncbi:MAG: hypothetical protein HC851_01950 [Acaryochloris sp. RU_4_1]|nr:hypothetical protein [Acaryochloris sp. RU_4_1]NJR53396.1 hypothetical protein [Acaryochloris sp. CRU_2_0]